MSKTLEQFEQEHGGSRISALQKQLSVAARKRSKVIIEVPDDNNTIQFGAIADTHFGSLYEAKDELAAFYSRLQREGITLVLHAGDVLTGHNVYRGHEFEVHALGWQKQREWFNKVAPKIDGITTHFITGNHDASFKKQNGLDVGVELEKDRPDWKFLGEDIGDITLQTANGRKYRIMIVHPDGGTAYAISYKMQGQIGSLEGGSKPNMILGGHYHKAMHLPSYRNVDGVECGCFEWQTPFLKRKGSAAHVGGWIMRVNVGSRNSLSNSVRAEFVSFYGRSDK